MYWRVALQFMVLLGESLETSGGRIQMEEVDTWSLVLDGIDLDPFLFSPPHTHTSCMPGAFITCPHCHDVQYKHMLTSSRRGSSLKPFKIYLSISKLFLLGVLVTVTKHT